MKYGIVFTILGVVCAYQATVLSGFYYIFYWPAVAFFSVGISYLNKSSAIFQKRRSGILNPVTFIILMPFIELNTMVWHMSRILSKENPYDKLDERLYIGRRLLNREVPDYFKNIIDLTSEFNEPKSLRSKNYINIPLLDASVPNPENFIKTISQTQKNDGITYIHCAQGHGRTGLASATWLMLLDSTLSPEEAILKIQAIRPKLDINMVQKHYLKNIRTLINNI